MCQLEASKISNAAEGLFLDLDLDLKAGMEVANLCLESNPCYMRLDLFDEERVIKQ